MKARIASTLLRTVLSTWATVMLIAIYPEIVTPLTAALFAIGAAATAAFYAYEDGAR
jgi:hypothetical protein